MIGVSHCAERYAQSARYVAVMDTPFKMKVLSRLVTCPPLFGPGII